VEAAWGKEYRRGRWFHRLVGVPAIAAAGVRTLDAVSNPSVRARLLFWEQWSDPETSPHSAGPGPES